MMVNPERNLQLDPLVIDDPVLMELDTAEKLRDMFSLVEAGAKTMKRHEPWIGHIVVVRLGGEL